MDRCLPEYLTATGEMVRIRGVGEGEGDLIDRRFVADVRAGTSPARAALYRRFSRRVLICVAAIVPDPEWAVDLTHDAFVKAFEAAGRFDGEPAALLPWLLVIARNTALDHIRRSGRTINEDPAAISSHRPLDANRGPAWGDDIAVHAALDRLSALQRRVLVLRYRADLDTEEIARVLGKSADAVRHLEQRALIALRGDL